MLVEPECLYIVLLSLPLLLISKSPLVPLIIVVCCHCCSTPQHWLYPDEHVFFSITVAYNSASVMVVGDIPTPHLVLLMFISLMMRYDDLPVVVVLLLVVESPGTRGTGF